jgi:uncharacterized membrane protein YgdD (TMEM256/DUF423 family)
MKNLFMTIAGVNGLLAVGIGAFGAHIIKPTITPESFATFQTGVLYHMVHTLALLGTSILITKFKNVPILNAGGWFFTFGIVLFSGSLYLLSISGVKILGAITPLGGLSLMCAWACLIRFSIKVKI